VILTVDGYVEQKVLPQYRDLADAIRRRMRQLAPDAVEEIAYTMPCYKGNRIFAYFNANKTGITLSFTYGRQFEDKFNLLRGSGKEARQIKVKSLAALNDEALQYYVKQALAIDAARP
jgi:hypothetical protein